eukprot:TRINITY_DN11307_c0_g1_i3.p1 TRINITY_DN11307_c0_g1~~TRINITY_DN11307_c0_g1_i3.p1  ORF type:complete len:325 (-),score=32.05 TRINITY_DN11307_c0_g1_i3:108-1082(-)
MQDTAHLLADFSGFLISIASIYLARRPPTPIYTFGFQRAEVIGSFISIMLIWVLTGMLIWEAVERLFHPQLIDTNVMVVTAAIGLAFNLIMAFVLHAPHGHHGHGHGACDGHGHGHSHSHGHEMEHRHGKRKESHDDLELHEHDHEEHEEHEGHRHSHDEHEDGGFRSLNQKKDSDDLNLRSAMAHVIGDIFNSAGVLIASIIIYINPKLSAADPICTFLFSIIVIMTTLPSLKDSLRILMQAAPPGISPSKAARIRSELSQVENVISITEFHLWSLTTGKTKLTAQLLSHDPVATLRAAKLKLTALGLTESTIQVSHPDESFN